MLVLHGFPVSDPAQLVNEKAATPGHGRTRRAPLLRPQGRRGWQLRSYCPTTQSSVRRSQLRQEGRQEIRSFRQRSRDLLRVSAPPGQAS
jgi:hypothetical protein